MNPWDLFTLIMAAFLGAGSLTVFAFFLRDAGRIWRDLGRSDRSETDSQGRGA